MRAPLAIADLGAKALTALDAERAHALTIKLLQTGHGPKVSKPTPSLATHVAGLSFSNCLGLAAGFDKNAQVPNAMLDLGFGFVEVGAVTPRAQTGNAKPRAFRLRADGGVINRYGFNNDGLDVIAKRLKARNRKGILGINLGANKLDEDGEMRSDEGRIDDYVTGIERLAGLVDFYTVNISSPNTPGLRALQNKTDLEDLMARVIAKRDLSAAKTPVFLKIAPDLRDEDKADIADIAEAMALDGLIISNTTIARPESLQSAAKHEAGGLSGAPLFAPSTQILRDFRKRLGDTIPLIGVGGVSSARQAYEKILAGASLVQLYTALVYEGPGLPARILETLPVFLHADGFKTIRDAVGQGV